jgi:hypothetical protein
MELYALVVPLGVLGAVWLLAFTCLVPWVWPKFPRPHVVAWVSSSAFIGASLFIDQIVVQGATLVSALLWFVSAALFLAVLVPLIWLRVHMWDHIFAAEERRQQADLNARYRAKDFVE